MLLCNAKKAVFAQLKSKQLLHLGVSWRSTRASLQTVMAAFRPQSIATYCTKHAALPIESVCSFNVGIDK